METTADTVLSDPRWNAFLAQGLPCSCGERHVGPFPIHLHQPLGWTGPSAYENDDALRMDGDFLSSSFCVMGGRYFAMRMSLPVQIRGADPTVFLYTCWASLSRLDFEMIVRALRAGAEAPEQRVPARLLNRVGGYPDTFNLTGSAFPQAGASLPVLLIHGMQANGATTHPLIVEQHGGIGMDRVLELFAAYNHEMRSQVSG